MKSLELKIHYLLTTRNKDINKEKNKQTYFFNVEMLNTLNDTSG